MIRVNSRNDIDTLLSSTTTLIPQPSLPSRPHSCLPSTNPPYSTLGFLTPHFFSPPFPFHPRPHQPPHSAHICSYSSYPGLAWWRNGRASDLRSGGREFDPRPGAAAYDDSGQVVHTQLPRRRHSSLVYRVVKLLTFALSFYVCTALYSGMLL